MTRLLEDIKRLAPTYLRLRRLAEPQTSRTVAAFGARTSQAREQTPVNLQAVALADDMERTIRAWLRQARKIGAGVDPDESSPRPMTIADAAKTLRVSEERIYRLIQQGRLGSLKIHNRRLVWSSDVEDYAEERRMSQAPEVGQSRSRATGGGYSNRRRSKA